MTFSISAPVSTTEVSVSSGLAVDGSPLAIPVAGLSTSKLYQIFGKWSAGNTINFYTHHTDGTNTNHGVISQTGTGLLINLYYTGTKILVHCSSESGDLMLSVAPTAGKTVDFLWFYAVSGGATVDYTCQIISV